MEPAAHSLCDLYIALIAKTTDLLSQAGCLDKVSLSLEEIYFCRAADTALSRGESLETLGDSARSEAAIEESEDWLYSAALIAALQDTDLEALHQRLSSAGAVGSADAGALG
ncbi:MAG TPA: hypothetical protein VKT32_07520 [Chthonomonadaceae bacterium]|nr:hypothetical protein [Chthonomonadaceae bacterium]